MSFDIRRWKQDNRFLILLTALLFVSILPALRGEPDDQYSALLLGVVMVAAVSASSISRRWTLAYAALALFTFSGRITSVFAPEFAAKDSIDAGGYAVAALFLTITLVMVFGGIARAPRVTGDSVMGAICVYMLIGYTWANLYALVEFIEPGSFNFPAYAAVQDRELIPEFTFGYYSFVTLTTLGYGDVTPITYRARTLSWLEAVVGVSYMATVIAFLVARVVSDREQGWKM